MKDYPYLAKRRVKLEQQFSFLFLALKTETPGPAWESSFRAGGYILVQIPAESLRLCWSRWRLSEIPQVMVPCRLSAHRPNGTVNSRLLRFTSGSLVLCLEHPWGTTLVCVLYTFPVLPYLPRLFLFCFPWSLSNANGTCLLMNSHACAFPCDLSHQTAVGLT